jgi:glycosyltransferase involved in cell wall biosynthesis
MNVTARSAQTVFFHRRFAGLTGGHLKVWDYFRHVAAAPGFCPRVHLTPDSSHSDQNPWLLHGETPLAAWDPAGADILFLAGLDWEAVPASCDRPVINLIQSLRHTLPGDPRHAFLSRRAVRICVSETIAAHLREGQANGPVLTIPPGLETTGWPAPSMPRDLPVLLSGLKQPDLAGQVAAGLAAHGIEVEVLTELLPRPDYLARLARAQVAIFLPVEVEGFYLPALEAMGLGALVVCPQIPCIGSYLRDGINGFCPAYDAAALVAAVVTARELPAAGQDSIRTEAATVFRKHSIERERESFHALLADLPSLLSLAH